MPQSTAERVAPRGLALLLTIGGAIGLTAAADLLIEKIKLIEDFNPEWRDLYEEFG